ncbi:MAG: ComEC/Rec2 family competence protein [Verrucomicrobia bacterium]|nr:ComEC/Rec2 family competence protein [Verrucomicrobiota bacterium]
MTVPSYRAPLLWLLLPMMCGYVLGHHLPEIATIPAVVLALVALITAYWTQRGDSDSSLRKYWPLLFFIGVSATSLLYYQHNRRFPDLWEILPPREAKLQIKVKRLYASNDPSLAKGVATITGTEDHLRQLKDYLIYFSIVTKGELIDRGQHLNAQGVLNYLPSKESPTLFEKFLQGQSIPLTLTRAYLLESPQDGSTFEVLISNLRKQAIHTLGIQLDDFTEQRSIYRGMVLGIKGELSSENKQLFLRTGTLHLFAISGLHVGIIAVTWASIFLVLRIPRRVSVVLGLALVYLYVEVTGASPSAIRAFAMTAFFWAGKSLFRQMPPFQALVASAVTVLLISPTQLFSAGFQLSYTVVTGILLWGIPLYQTLRDAWYARILQKQQHLSNLSKAVNKGLEMVVGTFCISLSATLSSAPLSILYFGLLAPFAVILNMFLVPIASLIIVSGLFSLIFGFLQLSVVSSFFNHGPLLLILITETILEKIVQTPGAFSIMAWLKDWLGYATVFLFLGSLLAGHGFRFPKLWRFTFPVVITVGMILLNSALRYI